MTEGIWIALIGAGGVIIAAIIGLLRKSEVTKRMIIKQKAKGNDIAQIGIQIDKNRSGGGNHERKN